MGDESTLKISLIASSTIQTNAGDVLVPNVLLVPSLYHNLLSINCLAHDLNCILLFDEHGFKVKKKGMGKARLSGSNSDGLYHLQGSNQAQGSSLSCV